MVRFGGPPMGPTGIINRKYCFWLITLLLLILQPSNVLGGNGKPYVGNLENWVRLSH